MGGRVWDGVMGLRGGAASQNVMSWDDVGWNELGWWAGWLAELRGRCQHVCAGDVPFVASVEEAECHPRVGVVRSGVRATPLLLSSVNQ